MTTMPTFIVDEITGDLTVEGLSLKEARTLLGDMVSGGAETNCAKPIRGRVSLEASPVGTINVHAIYTGSVVDGPGRRNVLQTQGCSVRCAGCFVPETHESGVGVQMTVSAILDRLLDPVSGHIDGISLVGGEPLDQAEALLPLLCELRERGIDVTLYSGRSLRYLLTRGTDAQRMCLALVSRLIDGAYVQALARPGLDYRGSANQKIRERPEILAAIATHFERKIA